jgi:hypothetical protein
VSSLPATEPGTRVRLAVGPVDLIERVVALTYRETLGPAAPGVDDATDEAGQKA